MTGPAGRCFLLFLAIIVTPVFPAFSQNRPVMAVYPLGSSTVDSRLGELGRTVTHTVSFSLALLGNWEVQEFAPHLLDPTVEELAALSRENMYDAVLFGSITVTPEGYGISVSLYKHRSRTIEVTQERSFTSMLDSFETADELALVLVDEISGERITYGALRITPQREEPFRLEIDGIDLGPDARNLERVVTGEHHLAFFQDRGSGELPVGVATIVVKEGETYPLIPPIPWLTPEEAVAFREIDDNLHLLSSLSERDQARGPLFARARELAAGSFFSRYRPELEQRYRAWQDLYASPQDPSTATINSMTMDNRARIGAAVLSTAVGVPSVSAKSGLPEKSLALRMNMSPSYGEITVDGSRQDWKSIMTTFTDMPGDPTTVADPNIAADDIIWVGVATDGVRLFFAMETAGREYINRQYRIDLRGPNILALFRERTTAGEESSGVGHVRGVNWTDARWQDSGALLRSSFGEIAEFSMPLSEVEAWVTSTDGVLNVQWFVQENHPEWTRIDGYDLNIVLPTLRLQLSASRE